jgi:GNAT superfamily N-acetyltransferase
MLSVQRITSLDDLEQLCANINSAQWDSQNDLSTYTPDALSAYLANDQHILLICTLDNTLAGIGSGVMLQKPYDHELWLYVDEIDVTVNHRRKGVGTALMKQFLTLAKEKNCAELWVGSEKRNKEANTFYPSLKPTEIDEVTGYTFKIDNNQ